MQYQLRYKERDSVIISIDRQLTITKADAWYSVDDETPPKPPFVADIFGLDGVTKVIITRYTMELEKGGLFRWDDILPYVLYSLSMHLDGGSDLVEITADTAPLRRCASIIATRVPKQDLTTARSKVRRPS